MFVTITTSYSMDSDLAINVVDTHRRPYVEPVVIINSSNIKTFVLYYSPWLRTPGISTFTTVC